MATGERKWTSSGKTPAKMEFKPIPAGEYELKLDGSTWQQRIAEGEGKIPYLNGSFTVLGSAMKEGGKDRKVFHRLFLGTEPGKDGVANCERGNSVLGLVRGLGTEINPPVVTMNGHELLNPKFLLQFLKSNDGAIVKGEIKIDAGSKEYGPSNRITFFVESDEQQEASEEVEEAPAEETEEVAEEEAAVEEEAGFPEVEEVEEEAEFEAVPAPKKAAPKPAAKPVAKAAAKPAPKRR